MMNVLESRDVVHVEVIFKAGVLLRKEQVFSDDHNLVGRNTTILFMRDFWIVALGMARSR